MGRRAGGPDRRMVRAVCQGIRSLFESPFRVRPARPFLHRRTLGATPNLLWGVVQYLLAWSGGPGGPSTGHGFTAKDDGRGFRRSTPKRVWGGTPVKQTLPMGWPPAGSVCRSGSYGAWWRRRVRLTFLRTFAVSCLAFTFIWPNLDFSSGFLRC